MILQLNHSFQASLKTQKTWKSRKTRKYLSQIFKSEFSNTRFVVSDNIIMNTFFKSQFNYCPLVWMFCKRSLNTKTNRLHERCLRRVYNEKKSDFNELLVKDGFLSIHRQNLQKLAIKMFKVSRGLNPEIVNELFQFREQLPYDLRQRSQFQIPWVHSIFSGTESLKFLGPKVWTLVPNEMKQLKSLEKLRNAIRQWKPTSCPCRLCKNIFIGLGFFKKKLS